MITYAGFRKRLVRMLATTEWATRGATPEELARHARGLGVAPEVLQAAHDIVAAERRARALKPAQGRKVNERHWPQLEIHMPEKVFEDWHTWCELQQATSNALIRGILHVYLLGTWEPAWVSSHWRYKGQTLVVPVKEHLKQKTQSAWPCRERVLITRGAKDALSFRGNRTNARPTAIVRGLILELLEGRYKGVVPRDARSMFDDVHRYTRHLNSVPGGLPGG